jgi:electron transport complex protein RnfB
VKLLSERINDALPQTQCTRCAYPDCEAYALAIAGSDADINQCPPGGSEGITRLAAITGKPFKALNPIHGREGPRQLAVIDENWCIGCTLCLDACPTDAIVGSNKLMHTVIEPYCTGCELCIPVCPVDCISLEIVTGEHTGWAAWSAGQAEEARIRYEFHSYRGLRDDGENQKRLEEQAAPKPANLAQDSLHIDPVLQNKKRAVIEAALARARARRDAD